MAPAIDDVAPDARGRRASQLVDLANVPVRPGRISRPARSNPTPSINPDWARAVSAHARGRGDAKALLVWDSPEQKTLIGLLPVVSAWRALKLPIPVFVAWQAYAPLTTPLLDRDAAEQAAGGLLDAAQLAGAGAILFQNLAQDGPAAAAIAGALARRNIRAHVHDDASSARGSMPAPMPRPCCATRSARKN